MNVRSALALLVLLSLGGAAGCTAGTPSPLARRSGAPLSSTPPSHLATGHRGAAGCRPASPVTMWTFRLPQVEGTGHGASLWGLLMFPRALPARTGDQEKIVWRMTGTGLLTMSAIGPDGVRHRLAWGPDYHLGSDWTKPGQEWGAGYVFTIPGCWDLHAVRGKATADVWLRVVAR